MINEGIIKINSKVLEPSDLKRLDKQEKENITTTAATVKGRKTIFDKNKIYCFASQKVCTLLADFLFCKLIKSNVNNNKLVDKKVMHLFYIIRLMKCEKKYHLR